MIIVNKRNFLALFLIFFIFLICLNSVSAQDVLADGGSRLSNNQSGSLIAEGYNGDENHELLGVESSSDYELLGGDSSSDYELLGVDSSSDYELLGVESSNENILTNGEFISNFTALNKSIYECDGVIELNSNITRLSAELNNTSIIIDKNITINGNGYTIDCGGQALFKISSNASLVLNNLTMVNAAAFYSIRHYFVYSDANNNTFLFGPGSPDTPYSRFEITSTVEDSAASVSSSACTQRTRASLPRGRPSRTTSGRSACPPPGPP